MGKQSITLKRSIIVGKCDEQLEIEHGSPSGMVIITIPEWLHRPRSQAILEKESALAFSAALRDGGPGNVESPRRRDGETIARLFIGGTHKNEPAHLLAIIDDEGNSLNSVWLLPASDEELATLLDGEGEIPPATHGNR